MIHEINTINDVVAFIEVIAEEIKDGNPFEEFRQHQRYKPEEATLRERLMERCFDICKGKSQNFICLAIVVFQEARDYPYHPYIPQSKSPE